MGKGKGLIERKVIRVRRGFILFEFLGVPFLRLNKLIKKINKVLDVKFHLIHNSLFTYRLWTKNNKYMYYHNKYLFQ